jgi:hypothetical protein
MQKKRECEEIVKDSDTGKSYRFAGTFQAIREIHLAGRNISLISEDMVNGLIIPDEIKTVLVATLEQVDGKDIADSDKELAVVGLIESAGLDDSVLLARMMLSHAAVGAIKKKAIRNNEQILSLIPKRNLFPWKALLTLGSFVAVTSTISIAAAYMIFR